jgi:hypothetical protein
MAALRVDSISVWVAKLVLLSTFLLGWMRCVAALGGSKSFILNDHLATKASPCRVGSLSTSKLQPTPSLTLAVQNTGPQFEAAPLWSSADLQSHDSCTQISCCCAVQAPYTHRVRIKGAPSLYDLHDPPGYEPIFLWLLSRHGSRW